MSKYPASMTSSVRAHVYEGGLRYHAFRDGRYAFPNDEVEQNRDDMKHTMCLMLSRGKHFYSPIEDKLRTQGGEVLDLGMCIPANLSLLLALRAKSQPPVLPGISAPFPASQLPLRLLPTVLGRSPNAVASLLGRAPHCGSCGVKDGQSAEFK